MDWASEPQCPLYFGGSMICVDSYEVRESSPVVPVRYRRVEDNPILGYIRIPPLARGDAYLGSKRYIFDDGG